MSIEKLRFENPQEFEQMIKGEIGQVEKDLTVICDNIPVNDKATLDILCHDDNGQLVIVQLSVNEDDMMLLHGIQSLDYVDKFKTFLKATYNKHKIDDKEKPRLILVAPSFSDAVRHAVESMKGIRVDMYEWEYLKLGDHKGLRLQPIFALASTAQPREREEKPEEKRREPKSMKKKEPAPEPMPEEPEPSKKELPMFPPEPAEEPEKEEPRPPAKEEPRKKLRLF